MLDVAGAGADGDGYDTALCSASKSATNNEGNFRETLRLMVASGDTKLQQNLQDTKSKATYISKTTQNELINCIGDEILEKIIQRVQKCKFYAVLFNETTHISHTLQLSLILRYVSGEGENMEVHEDFIELIEPFADIDNNTKTNDDTYLSDDDDVLEHQQEQGTGKDHDLPVTEEEIKLSGKNLGQVVLRALKRLNIPLEKCAGIGTDGCSVMLSEVVGAVSEIQKEAINAVRTPCFNHKLNLSIAQSNKVVCIRNAVGTMKECIRFFDASSKRQRV